MIVLRHTSSDPGTLNIYYRTASTNTAPEYYSTAGITVASLSWPSITAVETPLILGGNYIYNNNENKYIIEETSNRMPAKGVIYYAKYWDKDLGNNNCSELAAWPHEVVGYKISGYYDGLPQTNSASKLILGASDSNTINFTPAQVVGDRYYNFRLTSTSAFSGSANDLINGWHNSVLRSFMNSSIYNAFPTEYQSLIEKIPIISRPQQASGTSSGATLSPADETITTDDWIYLPCYFEVNPSLSADSPYRAESIHAWSWLDIGSINNVYTLDSQNMFIHENNITNLGFLRFLFFQKPITPSTRIFHMSSINNPYSRGPFFIDNETITVQPGDIWYDDNIAYMYVSSDDVNLGIRIDKSKAAGSGGWAPATLWSLRSYDYSFSYRRYNAGFMEILANGAILPTGETNNSNYTRALVPQFSI